MPARYSWKGHLRLSLVTIPIAAYSTSSSEGGGVHFRQLHDSCHSPIKYQKVCPIHGEIGQEHIVLGYEYEKGSYALVSPEERKALQGGRERVIALDAFAELSSIDPIYFEGTSYYLVPEGKVAERSYEVLRQAMTNGGVCGIGKLNVGDQEHLILVRPKGDLLEAETLHFPNEIRRAEDLSGERTALQVSREELRLAETLIEASTPEQLDLDSYRDQFTSKMEELIAAKIAGKEIHAPAAESPSVPFVNVMDALKQSIAQKKAAKGLRPVRLPAAARKTRSGKSG